MPQFRAASPLRQLSSFSRPALFTNGFTNGSAKFFQLLGLVRAGILDNLWLESELSYHVDYYNNEIVAKGQDFTLDTLVGNLELPFYQYTKWMLILYTLDNMVRENTSNSKGLIDVLAIMMSRMRTAGGPSALNKSQRYTILEEALQEVTGLDYGPFIQDYIFGTTSLDIGSSLASTGVVKVPIANNYNKPYTEKTQWSKGEIPRPSADINIDGKTGIEDVITMLSKLSHESNNLTIDMNTDGRTNIIDVIYVLLDVRRRMGSKGTSLGSTSNYLDAVQSLYTK